MTDHAIAAAPDQPKPVADGGTRISSLDFIRGLAVMGILAANIVAFGQPFAAYMYPDAFLTPHGEAEGWMWIAQFVLIDGKMRALFTLLFGAGLYLFMERAWAKGSSRWLQARRLVWLGLFGLAHFFFIWRGDILFLYACAGLIALLFLRMSAKRQMLLGVLGYIAGGILYFGFVGWLPFVADAPADTSNQVSSAMLEGLEEGKAEALEDGVIETEIRREGSYGDYISHNISAHASDLGFTLFLFWFETLPLMLIGMALYRRGLFTGEMDQRKQRRWGWIGLAVGGVLTLLIGLWAKGAGFTYYGTMAAFMAHTHFPRLFMALGLAALLSLYAPSATGWLGQRISAAGRAAFTNYLGTSVVMLFVFSGWALGLFGELTRGGLYVVVVLAWAVMLAWSKPWLERYHYGPLEWLWRCLTYWNLFPLRR